MTIRFGVKIHTGTLDDLEYTRLLIKYIYNDYIKDNFKFSKCYPVSVRLGPDGDDLIRNLITVVFEIKVYKTPRFSRLKNNN